MHDQAPGGDDESGRRLIVGLGNPGADYADSRHNFGFMVIDELARRRRAVAESLCRAEFFRDGGGDGCDLAKPMTYMNRSGMAVRCLAQRQGYDAADVLLVYDEIALPLGTQRLRPQGSPAGHRGVESVVENLRTDEVPRLRLGIAPAEGVEDDLSGFVLAPFDADEAETVRRCVERAADACESWLRYGIAHTMNRFNGPLPSPDYS